MRDWAAYVRRRLHLPALNVAREAEIVEDLARQLDDAYRDTLSAGATEAEALARAERHVTDWSALAARQSSHRSSLATHPMRFARCWEYPGALPRS